MKGIRGQATVEHVGLVLLVALLLGAAVTVRVPPVPAGAILRAIGAAGSPNPSELEVVDRYMEVDLESFLAYRASPDRDPRLDWSTDECSAPAIGSSGASFDFTDACLRHDFGYRNYRRLGRFEERKALVDRRFLADMRAHCDIRTPDEVDRCRAWARAFYLAVHHLGHLAGHRPGA
jgi:hypothetical protein